MLGDERLDRRDGVGGPAAVQQGDRVALVGGEPGLLQPDRLELGDLPVGEAGVGGPAPQRQRLAEQPGRLGRGAASASASSRSKRPASTSSGSTASR
jgi:hypothetical protein